MHKPQKFQLWPCGGALIEPFSPLCTEVFRWTSKQETPWHSPLTGQPSTPPGCWQLFSFLSYSQKLLPNGAERNHTASGQTIWNTAAFMNCHILKSSGSHNHVYQRSTARPHGMKSQAAGGDQNFTSILLWAWLYSFFFQHRPAACLLKAGQYLWDDAESTAEDFFQMLYKRWE